MKTVFAFIRLRRFNDVGELMVVYSRCNSEVIKTTGIYYKQKR
jgi:hypothetical protein